MRNMLLLTVLGCCLALAAQATVYRWVDPDGTVHFSDQPHAGATEVTVAEPQTYSAPKPSPGSNAVPSAAAAAAAARAKAANFRYTSCSIGSPANEATVGDVESLPVTVSLDPSPRPTDHISVFFDGTALPGSGGGSISFTVSPLDRGTHTLAAMVTDAAGNMMCQSSPVNIYVHQPSVLAPQNPNGPGNKVLPNIH